MDLEFTFNDVLNLAQQASSAGATWMSLVRYLEERSGKSLQQLSAVDIERDVESVRQQIQELVTNEPPPSVKSAVSRARLGLVLAREVNFRPDVLNTSREKCEAPL